MNEAATNISYKIDDMTGDYISVRKWLDDDVSLNYKFYLQVHAGCTENSKVILPIRCI